MLSPLHPHTLKLPPELFPRPLIITQSPLYKSPAATTPAPAATAAKFHDPVAAAALLELDAAPPAVVEDALSPVELAVPSLPVEIGRAHV